MLFHLIFFQQIIMKEWTDVLRKHSQYTRTPEYNTVYFSFPLYDSISLYLILFMTFLNMIELEAESARQLAQVSSTKCLWLIVSWSTTFPHECKWLRCVTLFIQTWFGFSYIVSSFMSSKWDLFLIWSTVTKPWMMPQWEHAHLSLHYSVALGTIALICLLCIRKVARGFCMGSVENVYITHKCIF